MILSTEDLLHLARDTSAKLAGAEQPETETEETSPEDQLLEELVKTQAKLAEILAKLAQPAKAAAVNVAAPNVSVAAPNVTIAPPVPPVRYECDHTYDRNGDLCKTIITAFKE